MISIRSWKIQAHLFQQGYVSEYLSSIKFALLNHESIYGIISPLNFVKYNFMYDNNLYLSTTTVYIKIDI